MINVTVLRPSDSAQECVFIDSAHSISSLINRTNTRAVVTVNTIVTDAINIVLGAGSPKTIALDALRKVINPRNTIIFNLEQLESQSFFITEAYLSLLRDFVVLDYNQANIDYLQRTSNTKAEVRAFEFPLIPAVEFLVPPPDPSELRAKKKVLFFGALSPRRIKALKAISSMGLELAIMTNAFGADLARAISGARIVANIHYYENVALFEVPRCIRPVSLGVNVISESSTQPQHSDWTRSGISYVDLELLPIECIRLARDHIDSTRRIELSYAYITNKCWVDICERQIDNAVSALES